jgi:hypothetical protein
MPSRRKTQKFRAVVRPVYSVRTDGGLIRDYINDMKIALSTSAAYSALALALALPDICAAMHLRTPGASTTRRHYVKWCRDHIALFRAANHRSRRSFRPTHLYALRCAYLHNGTTRMGPRHDRARRSLGGMQLIWESSDPHPSMVFTMSARGFTRRRDLQVQMHVYTLCMAVASGVERWLKSIEKNRLVQRNLGSLVGIDWRGETTY